MEYKKTNIPRTITFPTYKGNPYLYANQVELALTTEFTDLWARAETLDENSNIEDKVIVRAYIGDLAVGTAQIDNLAVTNAKIDTLAVSKLTAGTIASQAITLGVTGGTGDVCIKSGKTDFGQDTTAGFILGVDDSDGDKTKFEIGSNTNLLKWDGSALTIRGSLNAADIGAGTITSKIITLALAGGTGDCVIKCGKTDFGDDTTSGFILGIDDSDSDKVKFEMGGAATKMLKWDGTNLTIRGGLAVEDLAAGTITSKAITLAVSGGTGDVKIQAGKTDFGQATAGFILGMDDSDSDKPKFEIGTDTVYMKWDGAALTIRGTLNASDLTAGTIAAACFSTAIAYITNTAQIANAVISTANIGLLQVTSATIAELTVGTTKITGNAVTRGDEFWAAGNVELTTKNVVYTLADVTVTTNVDTDYVWLWGSFVIMENPYYGSDKTVTKLPITVSIRECDIDGDTYGTIADQMTVPIDHILGTRTVLLGTALPGGAAGTKYYRMYAQVSTGETIYLHGTIAYRMLMALAKSK